MEIVKKISKHFVFFDQNLRFFVCFFLKISDFSANFQNLNFLVNPVLNPFMSHRRSSPVTSLAGPGRPHLPSNDPRVDPLFNLRMSEQYRLEAEAGLSRVHTPLHNSIPGQFRTTTRITQPGGSLGPPQATV